MTVDTTKYLEFVDGVTSEPSKDLAQLLRRITELVRLIHYDTVACNDEEQEFWNTIVRKLRNHYDS